MPQSRKMAESCSESSSDEIHRKPLGHTSTMGRCNSNMSSLKLGANGLEYSKQWRNRISQLTRAQDAGKL